MPLFIVVFGAPSLCTIEGGYLPYRVDFVFYSSIQIFLQKPPGKALASLCIWAGRFNTITYSTIQNDDYSILYLVGISDPHSDVTGNIIFFVATGNGTGRRYFIVYTLCIVEIGKPLEGVRGGEKEGGGGEKGMGKRGVRKK